MGIESEVTALLMLYCLITVFLWDVVETSRVKVFINSRSCCYPNGTDFSCFESSASNVIYKGSSSKPRILRRILKGNQLADGEGVAGWVV